MENYKIQISSVSWVTHDVIQLKTTKPEGYSFTAGQAIEIALNKEGWRDEKRPTSFHNPK